MLKLLLCLGCALAIAVAMLELRQQELELKHRAAKLQEEIEGQQAKLWSQQLQIAIYTAPNALTKTVSQHELDLVHEGNAGDDGPKPDDEVTAADRNAGGL
jgi:hypothetical protein